MTRWWSRLVNSVRPDRAERELAREMAAHLALLEDDYRRRGMTPDEARYAARRAIGGVEQAKELQRDARSFAWLEDAARDTRHALRVLRCSPGFTAAAVVTLALGIGANAAMFTLVDAILLRPLPVGDPDELVQIAAVRRDDPADKPSESFPSAVVRALEDQRDIFAAVGAFSSFRFDAGVGGEVRRTPGAFVTGGYYETLAVGAAAGRLLSASDDRPGAPPVAVISHGYWQRAFGRDPGAIGAELRVNGRRVTIVGVSARGFSGAQPGWNAEIILPSTAVPDVYPELKSLLATTNFWLRVLARPHQGMSRTHAATLLATRWPALAERIAPARPAYVRDALLNRSLLLQPGGTGWTPLRDTYERPLYVLMVLVGIVMLIACANLAGLLLARAATRRGEIALRFAIGAARGRIVRQLLTESALLSLAGAGIGIAVSPLVSGALVNLLSTQIELDLGLHWRVLTFTTAVAILATAAFGLAPAWQATAAGPASSLKTRLGVPRGWMLPSVVTAQVALCLLLLVGAGLFVQTLRNLRHVDVGFVADDVLVVDVAGRRPVSFYREALDAVGRLPGVRQVSLSTNYPLSGSSWSEPVEIEGRTLAREQTFVAVSPGYFETLGATLLRGRDFAGRDRAGSPLVAIVNETFVRRHLAGGDPLRRRLSTPDYHDIEIVGVAKDMIGNDLRRSPSPTVYLSWFQITATAQTFSTLQVRASSSIPELSEAIRKELQPGMDGTAVEVRTLAAQIAGDAATERLMTTLTTGLGALALVLASIGLYGVLAYSAAVRRKEIGIRLALGASRRAVLGLVLGQGAWVATAGIVLGIAAAAALTRYLEELLFGLTPLDARTFAAVAAGFAAIALVASYIPARRAARVDPLTSLRYE
jgi:predicted permease